MTGKIFIIEDEPSIIQLVQHNLEKEGFVVSSSLNGNEGLKELKKFQPNLLLLDWMLPDLSGIDVCKNIRRDNIFRNLPILMLTAKGEEEDERHAELQVADDEGGAEEPKKMYNFIKIFNIDDNFWNELKILNFKHDLIGLQIYDS